MVGKKNPIIYSLYIKDTHSYFSAILQRVKKCDFLFALLYDGDLAKQGQLLRERTCFQGGRFFPMRGDTHWEGRQKRKWKSCSPAHIFIHLNSCQTTHTGKHVKKDSYESKLD